MKFYEIIACVSAAVLLFSTGLLHAEDSSAEIPEAVADAETRYTITLEEGAPETIEIVPESDLIAPRNPDAHNNNWENMGRGTLNVVTCFLEVPRCLLYRNSQVPLIGLVGGAFEGVGLTGLRAVAGVSDILSFGFMSDAFYQIPGAKGEYVWDEPWVTR